MDVAQLADHLLQGGIGAFPTETVYGLGACALNPGAVARIFEAKGRPADNPLIVHVDSPAAVDALVAGVPASARLLMAAFWPGPLALILPKHATVPDNVTAGLPNVAVRCPDHPLALDLLKLTGPLAAPSANRSGRPSPTTAAHVRLDFGDRIPVLDGGACRVGLESTVLDLTGPEPVIYRPGAISQHMLEAALKVPVRLWTPSPQTGSVPSPGMKYTHYAPKASIGWWDGRPAEDALILSLTKPAAKPNDAAYAGDFEKMARELYDRFRQADQLKLARVLIEPFEPDAAPVAPALRNRIEKAIGR